MKDVGKKLAIRRRKMAHYRGWPPAAGRSGTNAPRWRAFVHPTGSTRLTASP